jgi:geranylgeranyl diphosphate synthase type I
MMDLQFLNDLDVPRLTWTYPLKCHPLYGETEKTSHEDRFLSHGLIPTEHEQAGADHIRCLLAATGAREAVERLTQDRYEQAEQALERAPFLPAATTALRDLALASTVRTT